MNLTNILVGLLVVALIAAFGGFTQFAEKFSTTIEHELAARRAYPSSNLWPKKVYCAATIRFAKGMSAVPNKAESSKQ